MFLRRGVGSTPVPLTPRATRSGREPRIGDAPQPDWVTWVDEIELQIMTGRCWTELRCAVPVSETALARYDDAHARDKSLYLSWLADS
ncbi:hypothetical protein GCM10023080_094150 [Streptomyces pseudoechinosporeus]